jgi:hypothetical protein
MFDPGFGFEYKIDAVVLEGLLTAKDVPQPRFSALRGVGWRNGCEKVWGLIGLQ